MQQPSSKVNEAENNEPIVEVEMAQQTSIAVSYTHLRAHET